MPMDRTEDEVRGFIRARMPLLWTVALLQGATLFILGRLLPADVEFGVTIILIAAVLLIGVLASPLLKRLGLVESGADDFARTPDWAGLRPRKLAGFGVALWGIPMAFIFGGLTFGGLLGEPPKAQLGTIFFALLFNLILWALGGVFFGLMMGGLARLGARIGNEDQSPVAERPDQQRGLLYRVTWGAGLGAWVSLPVHALTSSAIAGVVSGFLGAFLGMAALPAISGALGGHWRDRAALGWMAGWQAARASDAQISLRQRFTLRLLGMGVPMSLMLFGAMAPLFVDGLIAFGALPWAIYGGTFALLALAFSLAP